MLLLPFRPPARPFHCARKEMGDSSPFAHPPLARWRDACLRLPIATGSVVESTSAPFTIRACRINHSSIVGGARSAYRRFTMLVTRTLAAPYERRSSYDEKTDRRHTRFARWHRGGP